MYKAIRTFRDLEDVLKTEPEGRLYKKGDPFPATKRKISDERIEQLLSADNKSGAPVIKKVGK